jgi:hypothetical protein
MELHVRPTARADAPALADPLNEIIAPGGTTAYETPFAPDAFADAHIDGPGVITSMLAEDAEGRPMGFQILLASDKLGPGWGKRRRSAGSCGQPRSGGPILAPGRRRASLTMLKASLPPCSSPNTKIGSVTTSR